MSPPLDASVGIHSLGQRNMVLVLLRLPPCLQSRLGVHGLLDSPDLGTGRPDGLDNLVAFENCREMVNVVRRLDVGQRDLCCCKNILAMVSEECNMHPNTRIFFFFFLGYLAPDIMSIRSVIL